MNGSTEVRFVKAERISLKTHPTLDEKWVQKLIEKEPSILGLGDVYVRDKERIQPGAGRLDLLLQDTDTETSRAMRSRFSLVPLMRVTSSGRSNTGTLSASVIRNTTTVQSWLLRILRAASLM
jgi:hypothetical protein